MKASFKRRLEKLENLHKINEVCKKYAKVLYDADSSFDPNAINIDTKVVLLLPVKDNDRCKYDFSKQPYVVINN